MTDPRTDEDRIRGIVQAADMAPIPTVENFPYKTSHISKTSTIASGNDEIVQFTPPAGYIWIVKDLYAQAGIDANATGGYIKIEIYIDNNVHGLIAQANYDMTNGEVGLTHSRLVGDKRQDPPDPVLQANYMRALYATPSFPLTCRFANVYSSATHRPTRTYDLLYQEIPLYS